MKETCATEVDDEEVSDSDDATHDGWLKEEVVAETVKVSGIDEAEEDHWYDSAPDNVQNWDNDDDEGEVQCWEDVSDGEDTVLVSDFEELEGALRVVDEDSLDEMEVKEKSIIGVDDVVLVDCAETE